MFKKLTLLLILTFSLPLILRATPDYVITLGQFNNPIRAGSNFSLLNTFIQNLGSSNSPANSVRYYHSQDNILDASDILILDYSFGIISPSSGLGGPQQHVTMPVNASPGTGYIIAVADENDNVTEVSETNNISYQQVEILPPYPDYVITLGSFNSNVIQRGESFSLLNTLIQNLGTINSPANSIKYYYSQNNVIDGADILLFTYNFGIITPSSGFGGPQQLVTLPMSANLGTGFIISVVDENNTVVEISEDNNISMQEIEVELEDRPDYIFTKGQNELTGNSDFCIRDVILNEGEEPQTMTLPEFTDNQFANYSLRIKNIGQVDGDSPIQITFYFSEDNVLSASDINITSQTVNPFGAGNVKTINGSLFLQNWFSSFSGVKFIIAKVDDPDIIEEANENNNLHKMPICFITDSEGPEGGRITLDEEIEYEVSEPYHSELIITKEEVSKKKLIKILSFEGTEYKVSNSENFNSNNLPRGLYVFYYQKDDNYIVPEKVYID